MPRSQLPAVPLYLTPHKAADHIGVGRTRLLALLKTGKIKAKLDNGRRYFLMASLVKYMDTLADA